MSQRCFFKLSDKSSGGPSLFFNLKIAPFDEVNIRRAVGLGLNYESLAIETSAHTRTDKNGFAEVESLQNGHCFIRTHYIRRHDDMENLEWEFFFGIGYISQM